MLADLLTSARRKELPLTVFTAERINVWNMECERLEEHLSESFRLRYLSHDEIGNLVDLLEQHDCLGPNLQSKSRDERIQQFEQKAGRQLLLALHEATMGRRFEDILLDEYHRIYPQVAQQLYRTVCILNRMNVPVRAGLIARV